MKQTLLDEETAVAALRFRALLADFAPLPWEIRGDHIVDANGRIVIDVYKQREIGKSDQEEERARRVRGGVMTGIATVAGYRIGPGFQIQFDAVTGEEVHA